MTPGTPDRVGCKAGRNRGPDGRHRHRSAQASIGLDRLHVDNTTTYDWMRSWRPERC